MSKLKDIATIAGVSISTVSKALNNSSEIKKETKANIIRIARDLNYDLGVTQTEFSTKKSCSIGVICPEVNSNYYTQLISSIGDRIAKRSYSYTVAVTDFKPEKEEHYLEFFGNQGVDGIVLITENKDIQNIVGGIKDIWNIPLVLITTENETNDYDCIRIDDYHGAITGIEYLMRLGHKKIGYIGDNLTEERLKAYREVLIKNDIPIIDEYISISTLRFEECGYQGMKTILQGSSRPTAVFAAYDDIAIGAMRAITEQGLSIPEDISVIGMDNVTVCPYLYKGLTTVSNPIKEMAAVSISILSRKIEDKEFTVIQNVVLKPSLIIRETTMKLNS
ncbi:MAG: LacI family DNA-binding transcriptional regulator [Clostridiaceae bacterium]|nr:LacI family DNA-binding transcriptional regulator [Clostridiaceae bacterium]